MFVSTFKSEKSFEVSSASLRNSVVSRVARLQKSSPTTTKKMTLRRILESDNTEGLYSKRRFNSTEMQKRADITTRDTRRHRSARAGKFSEDGWRILSHQLNARIGFCECRLAHPPKEAMNELLRNDILGGFYLRRHVQFTGQFKVPALQLTVSNPRPCCL